MTNKPALTKDSDSMPVSFARVLTPERVVILDTDSKQAALDQLAERLASASEVADEQELKKAIRIREELLSTGIGLGIGVPHVRLDSVNGLVMAVGLAPQKIQDYESMDDQPVSLVFMIAANTSQHGEYIQLLAQISKLVKTPERRRNLLESQTGEELYANILEGDA
jgi:PTS system nitrogen regulatory IIA component